MRLLLRVSNLCAAQRSGPLDTYLVREALNPKCGEWEGILLARRPAIYVVDMEERSGHESGQ